MGTRSSRSGKDRLEPRFAHLRRLESTDYGLTVAQASAAFRAVYEAGSKPASILIRRSFVARHKRIHVAGEHDKTPRPKPPLATAKRSKGVALRLELTLLFLAQAGQRPTAQFRYPVQTGSADELGLIDFLSTGSNPRENTEYRLSRPAMRARQVTNALERLAASELQLVEVSRRSTGRLDATGQMWVNQETGPKTTGDVHRYRMPTPSEKVISVPVEFFLNGWVQVMTDSEIANWLLWRDQGEMREPGITTADDLFIDAQDRLDYYDLSRDVWDTHQMLTRIGLMSVEAGEVEARTTTRGTRFHREPHKFGLADAPLGQDGHRAMLAAVAELLDEL
ncbi:hypothetical protein [Cellulosimicrobium cellulans]|uniref:hypothetical protein n=1 Tax=Cellulosimicrobium cellulans TaxID=1710 RepID=UPI000848374A|nr:hypothetical protein [Cellulosimicrobium cellulans]